VLLWYLKFLGVVIGRFGFPCIYEYFIYHLISYGVYRESVYLINVEFRKRKCIFLLNR
jgi:hypothetical protein